MVSTINENVLLRFNKQQFIENSTEASYFDWIFSKGTNYSCYVEYQNSLTEEQRIGIKIENIRTVIYALNRPFQFIFFYWTLLIFILHKFNFKKPIMKIILFHYILRSSGNVIDKFGELLSYYYANTPITTKDGSITGYQCIYIASSPERHPLRWLLTRQIGGILWYTGEMIADWYPVLRTKAIATDRISSWTIYGTCIMFNISKIILILYHFTLSPNELYNEHGVYQKERVNIFYFNYWFIQLLIIYASVIYDISVYFVIKKNLSQINNSRIGFLKKFKSLSEYRILFSSIFNAIFLPIVSFTIIVKYYYFKKYNYSNLNFSFDEIRKSIANLQYYMIFIDQILLLNSKEKVNEEVKINNTVFDYSVNPSKRKKTDISYFSTSSSENTSSKNVYNNLMEYKRYLNDSKFFTLYTNNENSNSIFKN